MVGLDAMKGIISTVDHNIESLVQQAQGSPGLIGRDLVKEVTGQDPDFFEDIKNTSAGNGLHVVAYDCGIKRNILRSLVRAGCRVSVVQAATKASDVLKLHPDGIMLSNGPGDPEGVPYLIREVKDLIGRVPIFGICLGHQIMGLALGGRSFKLKFGHHGVNHPVKEMKTGQVRITVQNHGFCIDPDTVKALVQGLVKMRVRPYYIYQCQTLSGTAHFRTPVETGIEIISKLRGFTTGFSVPTYVLDTPYGKVPMGPEYIVDRDDDAVYLKNFQGKVWREPNPKDPGSTDAYMPDQ